MTVITCGGFVGKLYLFIFLVTVVIKMNFNYKL